MKSKFLLALVTILVVTFLVGCWADTDGERRPTPTIVLTPTRRPTATPTPEPTLVPLAPDYQFSVSPGDKFDVWPQAGGKGVRIWVNKTDPPDFTIPLSNSREQIDRLTWEYRDGLNALLFWAREEEGSSLQIMSVKKLVKVEE